jgi:Ca2+-binding EF-hand superfamily protein
MSLAAAALVFVAASLAAPAEGVLQSGEAVLVFPGPKEPFRLRLDLKVEGQRPSLAWDAFLNQLFDWFDRDGDGALSQSEVSHMFALPMPGTKALTFDFGRLDANRDGRVSRDELKAYCHRNGFGPIVVVVAPPSDDDVRLAALFSQALCANGNGKLTQARLRRAPESLRRFDWNEDEYLELSELLGSAFPGTPPGGAQLKLSQAARESDATLRLDVGAKAGAATLERNRAPSARLVAASVPGSLHRLHGPGGRWCFVFRTQQTLPDLKPATEFLTAQFKTILGQRRALTRAQLEEDASSSGLLALFPYADRNGDGRLTLAELEDYFRLIQLGVRAQVWVRASDHGQNPFQSLDDDGDGRLSYCELTRAAELMNPSVGEVENIPRQYELSRGGPAVKFLGGVPIPASARRSQPKRGDASGAPRWFQAMDRNGDGVLSPREFVGPPEVFRKLDANGDGVISPEEARRAGSR